MRALLGETGQSPYTILERVARTGFTTPLQSLSERMSGVQASRSRALATGWLPVAGATSAGRHKYRTAGRDCWRLASRHLIADQRVIGFIRRDAFKMMKPETLFMLALIALAVLAFAGLWLVR